MNNFISGNRVVSALVIALLVAATGPAQGSPEDKSPIKEVLGGASAGGFYQLLGETVAEMVRREYPGSSIAYEPGSQAGQLVRLINGEINLAVESPFELIYALRGKVPFERAYSKDDFKIVARIVEEQSTIIYAREEFAERYRLKTVADIAAVEPPVRITFFQRGNAFADALIGGIFGAYGITEERIRRWGGEVYYTPSRESARLMADRKLDVNASASWHPDATTTEVSRAVDVVALPVGEDVIQGLAKEYGLAVMTVRSGTYDFLTKDYLTVGVPGYLVASPKLADREAYKLAKALYDQFDYYKSAHPIFARFARAMLPNAGEFELHPGAARFYREVGMVADGGAVYMKEKR